MWEPSTEKTSALQSASLNGPPTVRKESLHALGDSCSLCRVTHLRSHDADSSLSHIYCPTRAPAYCGEACCSCKKKRPAQLLEASRPPVPILERCLGRRLFFGAHGGRLPGARPHRAGCPATKCLWRSSAALFRAPSSFRSFSTRSSSSAAIIVASNREKGRHTDESKRRSG